MTSLRTYCALLLALPLIGSAANHLLEFTRPPVEGYAGLELLETLRQDGLMVWVVLAHLSVGVLLLVPRLRFVAALVQLPISFGIVGFNVTLYPPGVPLALAMLALNLVLLMDVPRLKQLVQPALATR